MTDIDQIRAAQRRIAPFIRQTPLLRAPLLDRLAGRRVWVKAECLQITGAFKLRGASNALECLDERGQSGGVLAYSSGNHAQAVAFAASQRGREAVIVMPADAPEAKISGTRAYGGEVVLYDRAHEDRDAIGEALAEERGLNLVPPFDHADIIAGQGTAGFEIAAQAATNGIVAADVLVPSSGGGLASGIALALAAEAPAFQLRPVEVEGFDRTARSIKSGQRERNPKQTGSICDAIISPMTGKLPFEILSRLAGPCLAVNDDDAKDAMRVAAQHLKLVVEPGGAVALAAALTQASALNHDDVIVVASGGNVDLSLYAEILQEGHPAHA